MANFEGTTLALQHYYDIFAISRRLPLLTVYQAREQPFGRQMAVWMATYGDEIPVSDKTHQQLDDILLQNRAVTNPHVLRVLDYGTSEGHSFVVTDALDAGTMSLRDYLNAHGPLENWQVLRLIEQLTSIIHRAHSVGFRGLCLTSDIIFIRDEKRFEIVTGPLGIGLHRSDILKIKEIPVSSDWMRHIPPWEYAQALDDAERSRTLGTIQNTESGDSAENAKNPEVESPSEPSAADAQTANSDAQTAKEENANESGKQVSESSESSDKLSLSPDDSVQDLGADAVSTVVPPDSNSVTMAPAGWCPDVYNLAAIAYEALCGQHPCFNEDLCEAALTLTQGSPVSLDKRIEISTDLNDVVMRALQKPLENSETQFLQSFAECCGEQDRQNAEQAGRAYVQPPAVQKSSRKKRRSGTKFQHPLRWLAILLLAFIAATAFVTWKVARVYRPVDLFALPEIVPVAADGIDVVIAPRTAVPDTHIYLTSMADGSLILLGDLPYIHREQAVGTKLNFVITDDHGHSMQLPVNVNGKNGLMMVPVDLNW